MNRQIYILKKNNSRKETNLYDKEGAGLRAEQFEHYTEHSYYIVLDHFRAELNL